MSYTGEWSRNQTVTLDSNGNGTVTFQVDNASQTVTVTDVVVFTDQGGSLPIPMVSTYLNDPTPGNLKGVTFDGNGDVGHGSIKMGPIDSINVVFTGGVVGSHATAVLDGTYETAR